MRKFLRTLPILALLFVAIPHAYAGLSEGCYPAVQCDAGQDYYGTSCQKHIDQVIGAIATSCAASNPVGQVWNFSCTGGCFLSSVSVPSTNPCPAGVMVAGNCLATLPIVNDSIPVTGEKAYKIWDSTTLTEVVHVGTAGCADNEAPVSDAASPTGWKCGNATNSGLWSTDGTNVWRATGKVGIGTATPLATATLDVESTSGYGILSMLQGTTGAAVVGIGVETSTSKTYAGALGVVQADGSMNHTGGYFSGPGGTTRAGTNTDALDVSGPLKMGGKIYGSMGGGVTIEGAFEAGDIATNNASTVNTVTLGGTSNFSWGANSVAMGEHSSAVAYDSVVMGRYAMQQYWNGSAWVNYDGATWVATDPIFIIGDGTSTTASNSFIVLKNGKTGIGTDYPGAMLDVEVSSGAAATIGASTNSATGNNAIAMGSNSTASSAGAIALGSSATASGVVSLATGSLTEASGFHSAAFIHGAQATGDYSFAAGYYNDATANYATALGINTLASGQASTAMGDATTASGFNSTSMGSSSEATGSSSVAMGSSTASGNLSVAMGAVTEASDFAATAMGGASIASGMYSTAIGHHAYATSWASTVIGSYNVVPVTSSNAWVSTDPLFVVGNGTSTTSHNAFTVLKNGDVGIGDATPDYFLDVENTSCGGGCILSQFHGTSTVNVYGDGWLEASASIRAKNNVFVEDVLQIAVDSAHTTSYWDIESNGVNDLIFTSRGGGVDAYIDHTANSNTRLASVGLFKFGHNGYAYADAGYTTPSADYAEWFEAEENTVAGDLIGVNPKTGLVRQYHSGDIFIGIHSVSPSVIGNHDENRGEDSHYSLVGLLGQLAYDSRQVVIENGMVMTLDGVVVGPHLAGDKVLLGVR